MSTDVNKWTDFLWRNNKFSEVCRTDVRPILKNEQRKNAIMYSSNKTPLLLTQGHLWMLWGKCLGTELSVWSVASTLPNPNPSDFYLWGTIHIRPIGNWINEGKCPKGNVLFFPSRISKCECKLLQRYQEYMQNTGENFQYLLQSG